MPKTKARIPDCHPDRAHQAKGLCAECYQKQWRLKNAEKHSAYMTAYYEEHKDKLAAQNKAYREVHKARLIAYEESRREYKRIAASAWYYANRDRALKRARDPITREKKKDARLKRVYNLSLVEYDELNRAQNGGCAICGEHTSMNGRELAVDHDQTIEDATGKIFVRGLLCDKHNRALGMFDHNPDLLKIAIDYLAKARERAKLENRGDAKGFAEEHADEDLALSRANLDIAVDRENAVI